MERTKGKRSVVKVGSVFETLLTYNVVRLIRNPGPYAEFVVKEGENERQMRIEPIDRKKLKYTAEILKRTNGIDDKRYTPEFFEFGQNKELRTNFLITNLYGIQIEEVRKALKKSFTPDCVLNIAKQTLEAIKVLHSAGFISRNVKPATFSIGHGKKADQIILSDFRITRVHLDDKTKLPREPRKFVKWIGTARYASINAMRERDQGRRDDIESWIYMIIDLYDADIGLPWKKAAREKVVESKEVFKNHDYAAPYEKIPVQFKSLLDLVHSWNYDTTPDYDAIHVILNEIIDAKKLDIKICDWIDKLTPDIEEQVVLEAMEKTPDNKCSGQDDFEFAKVKKIAERKKMNPNDVIKNGSCHWRVVVLLGSGGFGDVYKVYNEKGKKDKFYALKTESEDGKKAMLRLKVEMQVMMCIQEFRKGKTTTAGHKHFVEFVDRGKSDYLKCKFIVMSLVGPSLEDVRKKYKVDLSHRSTPFVIAVQSLEAVHDLHNLGFLHRDIKPANFAVGIGPDEPTVFILDFGICRSYLDPVTKKHRAPRKSVKFLGTLRFASRACMKSTDQGRKDDLECWLYMIFDIMDEENGIPWRRVKNREKILAAKVLFFQFKLESAYENISKKMKQIVGYVDSLEYQSLPDYQFIEKRLIKIAEGLNAPITKKVEWAGKLNKVPREDRFGESSSDSDLPTGSDEDDD
ncbi:unnamed protein product [Caenorhabditis bovis]|uniref:Protein kinase domain-containing protein n=1 Tax=Caenorhabditis bovis TaxID=2654633 RepID=A0A8S1F3H5_9PELO|nr:unnamed protein product [Caenorhabditis bovis]